MSRASLRRTSREERASDHEKWVARHYLEEGKRYTFETRKVLERWGGLFELSKIMRWTVFIKQAECPWMIVACQSGFRTKFGAESWGRDYLKRGGPPEGFFDPPPPDPREIVFHGPKA